MNVIIEKISKNKAIIDLEVIKELVKKAKKVDKINIIEKEEDISTKDLMKLIETSKAFDFLKDEGEDIYTIDDLKVKYRWKEV